MVMHVACILKHGYACILYCQTWPMIMLVACMPNLVKLIPFIVNMDMLEACIAKHGHAYSLYCQTWACLYPVLPNMVMPVACIGKHGHACSLHCQTWSCLYICGAKDQWADLLDQRFGVTQESRAKVSLMVDIKLLELAQQSWDASVNILKPMQL